MQEMAASWEVILTFFCCSFCEKGRGGKEDQDVRRANGKERRKLGEGEASLTPVRDIQQELDSWT